MEGQTGDTHTHTSFMLSMPLQFEIKATEEEEVNKLPTELVYIYISLGNKLDCEVPETKIHIDLREFFPI